MMKSDEYLLRALVDHVNGGRVWTNDLGERINLAFEKAKEEDTSKSRVSAFWIGIKK